MNITDKNLDPVCFVESKIWPVKRCFQNSLVYTLLFKTCRLHRCKLPAQNDTFTFRKIRVTLLSINSVHFLLNSSKSYFLSVVCGKSPIFLLQTFSALFADSKMSYQASSLLFCCASEAFTSTCRRLSLRVKNSQEKFQ